MTSNFFFKSVVYEVPRSGEKLEESVVDEERGRLGSYLSFAQRKGNLLEGE